MKAAMYNLQFRLPRDVVMGTGASAEKEGSRTARTDFQASKVSQSVESELRPGSVLFSIRLPHSQVTTKLTDLQILVSLISIPGPSVYSIQSTRTSVIVLVN